MFDEETTTPAVEPEVTVEPEEETEEEPTVEEEAPAV